MKSLRTHGQEFHKGMAMRSRTELAWTLPGKFSRLEAVAGIDDDVRPLGSVRLQITGDGKSLFDAHDQRQRQRSRRDQPRRDRRAADRYSSWSRRATSARATISYWAI